MRETQVPIAGISAAKNDLPCFCMFLAFDYVILTCCMGVKNLAKRCLSSGKAQLAPILRWLVRPCRREASARCRHVHAGLGFWQAVGGFRTTVDGGRDALERLESAGFRGNGADSPVGTWPETGLPCCRI